jgi:lipopolysaccharide/colanic/teichoic acid biosynthesis glycosyltransferase
MELLFVQPLPAWKRAMDIAGAIAGMLLALPIMAIAAIAIKLTSPGPVIFKQKRIGLGGVPFTIYKFRTMTSDADRRKRELLEYSEQDGPAFKMSDDPRITRLGRLLRRTSIDELPQLWNVLVGNMSLVGPRPLPCEEAAQCRSWQRWRHDVTPGLTCFWQVSGRSQVSFAEWMRMDRRYVRDRSLAKDLGILAATVPAVLSCRGAQ